ncbi:AAA family ATPase, partial [Halobacteriales archaeon SW_7_68_16]
MDWTERYRPTTLSEIRGNDKARDALREWAETWTDHREAAIVHGDPGVGKTSAVHALAADVDWPAMELNASDQRTAEVVSRTAGEASKTGTLAAGGDGRRLVVLDEADNFHGNADYGGSREVTRLVKEASQPVVLIANEFYDMSKTLRNACREIEFRAVSSRSIVPVLREICRAEGVEFETEALETIAEATSGDLRSAIKDLQAVAEGRDRITAADVSTGERDRTEDIFDFLDTVIKEAGAEDALTASYDVDETPDDLINWIEDNFAKDYTGAELADGYERLAAADRWLGRVRATQNYSYWRYATDNMTAGVAAARQGTKGGWTRYGPPSYWSKLGRTKATRNRRDEIGRKIAEEAGTSTAVARREVVPFLETMLAYCRNRDLTVAATAAYDLDRTDVSFLTGSGEDTNKVASVVEDARERRESYDEEEREALGLDGVPEGEDGPGDAGGNDGIPKGDDATADDSVRNEEATADDSTGN